MAFLPEGQADRSQARSAWEPCREPRPGHMCIAKSSTSNRPVVYTRLVGVLEYWSVGVLGCWGRMSALGMNFERVGSAG
jgi:hypothetical protein